MEYPETGLLPDALVLGIAELDAQHEAIFVRIEALKALAVGRDPRANDGLQEHVAALIGFLEVHFATEERLAAAVQIDFSQHAGVHQRTLRGLHKASGDLLDGKVDAYSFARFVEFWFERHITEYDRSFGEQLQAREKRESGRKSVWQHAGVESRF